MKIGTLKGKVQAYSCVYRHHQEAVHRNLGFIQCINCKSCEVFKLRKLNIRGITLATSEI